jgi:hypothetical protein
MSITNPLTGDILLTPYGSPIDHQPIEYPIGKGASGQTLYRGSFAAISGGTTVTKGYLKNMAVPASNDLVVGMLVDYGPSCGLANTVPGMGGATLNTADGVCTAQVQPGTFLIATGGSAGDALTITNIQQQVYCVDEYHVGALVGTVARPVAGLLVAMPSTDASIPTGYVAVSVGTNNGPWGGV